MRTWRQLLETLPVPGLKLGNPRSEAPGPMEDLTADLGLLGGPIRDKAAALACVAGLWLRFDHFEKSHIVSQGLDNRDGSWWHGIAHRREGDFGNACYWFRRSEGHPAQALIGPRIKGLPGILGQAGFSPTAFTRLVEGGGDESRLVEVQEMEWQILFGDCLRRALDLPT